MPEGTNTPNFHESYQGKVNKVRVKIPEESKYVIISRVVPLKKIIRKVSLKMSQFIRSIC